MIHIENKKTYRGDGIYVGRKMPGILGSVLGNPFRIGRDGTRFEVIAKYRRWLWEQIKLKNEACDFTEKMAQYAAHASNSGTPSYASIELMVERSASSRHITR